MSESDERSEPATPIPVLEFEGEYVRAMEGKLPLITLEMPEGYARGTHLKLDVEVRVRNVRYEEIARGENKGDLVRQHIFALEEVRLVEAFDPDTRPENVGGSVSGDEVDETYLREAADLVIDTLDSSPETRAYIEQQYPGLAHKLDHLRQALGEGFTDEELATQLRGENVTEAEYDAVDAPEHEVDFDRSGARDVGF